MTETVVKNKGWTVTFAGMGINLALGVLYSWSVIKKAIPVEWGWSDADKALPYSIACIVFALVMVPAGRLQDRIGPRWVATAGGILTGIGCIIASYARHGALVRDRVRRLRRRRHRAGLRGGNATGGEVVLARKTGLIAGLVVAGFGLASVYISPCEPLDRFHAHRPAGPRGGGARARQGACRCGTGGQGGSDHPQAEFGGVELSTPLSRCRERTSRRRTPPHSCSRSRSATSTGRCFFGIGFLLVVTVLAQFLAPAAAGISAARTAPGGKRAAAPSVNLGPAEILRTPLFYLLWTMFAFAAGAGLMIIGNITTIAKLGKIEAGFILVALLAVGNAAGRIVAGLLSDRIGRLWTMFIIFLFQAALMMVLRTGLADMTAFVVVSMLLGFNYGACLSVFPSAVKDNFGLKNFGINYGLVFTAWGVGGFIFPLPPGRCSRRRRRPRGQAATTTLIFWRQPSWSWLLFSPS